MKNGNAVFGNDLSYLNGNRSDVESNSGTEGLLSKTPSESIFNGPGVPEDSELKKRSGIQQFFDRDFSKLGQVDGLNHPSEDSLKTAQSIIKSAFRQLLDREICLIEEKILELKNLLIEINQPEDKICRRLQNTIEFNQESVRKLEMQKDLSADDDGWVMEAIYKYNSGFKIGQNDRAFIGQYYSPYRIFNN